MDNTPLFFWQQYLYDYLNQWQAHLQRAAQSLTDAQLADTSDTELAAALVSAHPIAILEIDLAAVPSPVVDAAQVEKRTVFDERVTGPELRITQRLPFRGERALWDCRPSTSDLNPPRGRVLNDTTVELCIEGPIEHKDLLAQQLLEYRSQIDVNLARQKEEIAVCVAQAAGPLTHHVADRRRHLHDVAQVRRNLGT
ncbi:hypothetical protein [Burkholderia diffusa]|uniref:hypothetical protein n=1 Tax=Burkholderia diffusa TaxID=488732 RepID=UPI00157B3110|nr:hypothetical protein [Burkholderia diffusa]NTY41134.1 hypothetical protein [Burkholderia diffusa]